MQFTNIRVHYIKNNFTKIVLITVLRVRINMTKGKSHLPIGIHITISNVKK